MKFLKIFKEVAEQCSAPDVVVEHTPRLACEMCGSREELAEDGLCADCQKAVARGYQISQLAGRCANGAERDRGVRWHARLLEGHVVSWDALCGYSPGQRSAGWSGWKPSDRTVTCPRCVRRIEKLAS